MSGKVRAGRQTPATHGPRLPLTTFLLLSALLCFPAFCSSRRAGLKEIDGIEESLRKEIATCIPLMSSGDVAQLMARGDALIRLRLRAERLQPVPEVSGMRDALREALDAVIDAVGEAARGAAARGDGASRTLVGAGADSSEARVEKLLESRDAYERCQEDLKKAAGALDRLHALRAASEQKR